MKTLLVPENLQVDTLVKENKPGIPGFVNDKVHYICHAIYMSSLKLHEEDLIYPNKTEPYYVPLHTDILAHFLGRRYYKDILEWMVKVGIIESDGKYERDVISIGYRFCENYRFSRQRICHVEDFTMYKKSRFEFKVAKGNSMSRVVEDLRKHYKGLEMNINAATITNDVLHRDGYEVSADGMAVTPSKNKKVRLKHQNYSTVIDMFANHLGDYHFQDSFGRRLHSPITQLPKVFRSFVTYKGEELAQVDIRNSQLFFTLYLFEKKHWKRTKTNQPIWESIGAPGLPSSLERSIMSCHSSKSQYSGSFQDDRFTEFVCNGTLYDHFVGRMEAVRGFFNGRDDSQSRRQIVKDLLLWQIYGDEFSIREQRPIVFTEAKTSKQRERRLHSQKKLARNRWLYNEYNIPLWNAFREDFPVVASIFTHLKCFDYADLSKVLQRIESRGVLEIACKQILKELGEIPLYPLHDCLVTTVKNIEYVDEILKDSIEGYIGYAPSTELKHWSEYAELLPFNLLDDLAA